MGMFSDHKRIEYRGNVIEAEGNYTFKNANEGTFRLVINNKRADEVTLSYGGAFLRGEGVDSTTGKPVPITVKVKHGLLGTRYYLMADGRAIKMRNA
ncbi:hypothetical protein MYX77_00850 [Acidobacteriia bacterium AH_259_A11_L15]|nr:hypothetical protein [Acidobacteriia bacterium AH_259_A11_L15]